MILSKLTAIKIKPEILDFIIFIIAFFAIFFVLPKISLAQSIVINEFFTDPSGPDTGQEWVEIYNPGSQPINLSGWQLNAAPSKYFTFPDFTLAANSFVVVNWNAEGQNSLTQIFTGLISSGNMGNSSGYIAVFKSDVRNKDTIVDYVEYGQAGKTWESTAVSAGLWTAGQFISATGENLGQSAGLKNDGQDTNSIGDWKIFDLPTAGQSNATIVPIPEPPPLPAPSPDPSPPPAPETSPAPQNETTSPTADNQIPSTPSNQTPPSQPSSMKKYSQNIFINEFLPAPDQNNEWVELVSADSEIINISGWQIDDRAEGSAPQKIAEGTQIAPNQYLVIELTKNILNNEGDQVRLLWPDGQLLHQISFQKAPTDFSSSRFSDGQWLWTSDPTPGAVNQKPNQRQSNTTQQASSLSAQNQQEELPPPKANILAETSQVIQPTKSSGQTKITQENKETKKDEASLQNISLAEQDPSAADIESSQKSFLADKNYNLKTLAILGTLIVVSGATGIFLIKYRKKNLVDNDQPPF